MKFLLIIFSILFLIISLEIEARSVTERQKRPLIQLEFPIMELEIFFNCNDNKFISRDLVCDGNIDCRSGADEEFCEQNQLVHLRRQ